MNQTSDDMDFEDILVKKFSYDDQTYLENIYLVEIVMQIYFEKENWRPVRDEKIPGWNKSK